MHQHLIFGSQYFRPPAPSPAEWDTDFARMREMGMNTIKAWAIWGWMEPEPGRYVFDDLDQILDVAHSHKLAVQINLAGNEMAPFWLERVVPGARRIVGGAPLNLQNSLCCIPADFSAFCPDHPGIGPRMEEFYRVIARRYGSHPALLNWDAWNEIMAMGCYCEYTLAAYRVWLKRKYGDSLDALNRAWFRRYCAWEDIRPPERSRCGYADMVEWKSFLSDHTAEQARRRLAAIKEGDPNHAVMIHHDRSSLIDARGSLMWGGDDWKLADAVDGYGTSWESAVTPIEPSNNKTTFTLDAIRGATGGGFWVSELHASGPMVEGFTTHDRPSGYREQKFWIWTALAAGAKGVLYWQYRPEMVGPESPGWGIVRPDGSLTDRARQLSETGKILEEHGAELAAATAPRPRVALLFDPEVAYMQQAENSPELFGSSLKGYHRLLWEMNIGCEFVHIRDIAKLGEYALVILPFPALIKDATVDILRRYVEQGGQLWAEAFLGRYGDNWVARPVVPGPGLEELFGVRFGEAAPVQKIAITVESGGEILLEDGFLQEQLELSADAKVLGWGDSGRQIPLAVEKKTGSGRTLFIGTLFGRAYFQAKESLEARKWFEERLRAMGIESDFRILPSDSGVRCRLIATESAAFAVYANHGQDVAVDISFTLPFAAGSAAEIYTAPACGTKLAGKDLQVSGRLGAREVWVVRCTV